MGQKLETIGYLEMDADYDIDVIGRFIRDGHVDGNVVIVLRNLHNRETCETLESRFYELIEKFGSDRDTDGFVKNLQIGSSQFHKNGSEYIRDTIHNAPHVFDLFSAIRPDQVKNLFLDAELENALLESGINYRAARHMSSVGNFATTRKWLDNGKMALHPHDDSAQLGFAAQDGFEVAKGQHTIAANFCIADDETGSAVTIWNLCPDDKLRKDLGLEQTGYPYPIDYMSQFESISLQLNAGDLYFMNASYVHGVHNSSSNNRITAGRFLTSFENKVVYWT